MSSESTPPIKSEDFWFEDGDIILSVTEDGVESHFCVHRATLTMASPVFRDMLSMPQPPECKNQLVLLIDDSVKDLEALLGSLYSSRADIDIRHRFGHHAHKYQIEGLPQVMRVMLAKHWPFKHSDYLARPMVPHSRGNRTFQAMELIDTVQRCQANELLPAAFYELACAWGTQWEDIVRIMSPENVIRLCVGRARSEQRLRALGAESDLMWKPLSALTPTISHHRNDFPPCRYHATSGTASGVTHCTEMIPSFQDKVASLLYNGTFVLPAIRQCHKKDSMEGCSPCKDWFMDVLKNRVQELWENIPANFNLPEVDSEVLSQSAIETL